MSIALEHWSPCYSFVKPKTQKLKNISQNILSAKSSLFDSYICERKGRKTLFWIWLIKEICKESRKEKRIWSISKELYNWDRRGSFSSMEFPLYSNSIRSLKVLRYNRNLRKTEGK